MLQQQAVNCVLRLKSAVTARGGLEESKALDALYKDLIGNTGPLRQACAKVRVLRGAGIPLTLPTDLAKPRTKIVNAAERFREKPAASTLKHGSRWAALEEAVSDAASAINSSLTASWTAYVNTSLFAGPHPDEEARSLAQSPQNKRALEVYRKLFEEFSQLLPIIPTQLETIARLQQLSRDLSAIRFERNVSGEVRAFLTATNSASGAGLSLLSEEVRKWLTESNLLESYVIRARMGRG